MAEAEQPVPRTPIETLAHPPGGPWNAGIVICERRLLGKVILRGRQDDEDFLDGTARVLGAALPTVPNRCTFAHDRTAVWLGPDEWLVITPPDEETDLAPALLEVCAAVTVTSDQSTVIRVHGPDARHVLSKGCAIDLHPRVFGTGHAAQSHIARVHATLWQINDDPAYEILVGCSFAPYLWAWLQDAGHEHGVRIEQDRSGPG